jgi:hypothetical protein
VGVAVVAQSDRRIEFESGAALEIRFNEQEVLLVSAAGERRRFTGTPLLEDCRDAQGRLHTLLDEAREVGLMGGPHADRIHFFDLRAGALYVIPTVERIVGSAELNLVLTKGLMLVMTENGVVAIDSSGQESWRISQTTYLWRFVADTDGLLWFADAHQNLIGIDRTCGEEAG